MASARRCCLQRWPLERATGAPWPAGRGVGRVVSFRGCGDMQWRGRQCVVLCGVRGMCRKVGAKDGWQGMLAHAEVAQVAASCKSTHDAQWQGSVDGMIFQLRAITPHVLHSILGHHTTRAAQHPGPSHHTCCTASWAITPHVLHSILLTANHHQPHAPACTHHQHTLSQACFDLSPVHASQSSACFNSPATGQAGPTHREVEGADASHHAQRLPDAVAVDATSHALKGLAHQVWGNATCGLHHLCMRRAHDTR
jgi:hypothetical protein